MIIIESILQALDSVRANKLRSSLTLLSIAIGVFAIIGAGGLVTSIDNAISGEMMKAGETSFIIKRFPPIQMGGHHWRKYLKRKPISYSQYKKLKEKLKGVKYVTAFSATNNLTIEYQLNETDADVTLFGGDENFLETININIAKGRSITREDVELNKNVAVIGNDIKVKLFPNIDPIGKKIKIKNTNFTVIGVMEQKGAVMGQSQDNRVLIPLTLFLKYYASSWEEDLTISIKAFDKISMFYAFDEAIGHMRIIRKVKPWEENNFEIQTDEAISQQFESFTGYLNIFGIVVGVFSLIAAGVGIMNIMLVSVKERTREIGIRKAIGAKIRWILIQFVVESITLSLLGGIIGIIFGLLISSYFGNMMGLKITIPIEQIILSIFVCSLIGIVFGAYPAWKAAKLDPIDALRYE